MLLFYVIGIGVSAGWTSVLACLVFYTETLGVNSFVFLNLAAYAPLLPITILQAKYDTHFDRKFGSSILTYTFRGYIGFVINCITLGIIPWVSSSSSFTTTTTTTSSTVLLCLITLLLGTASSVLFGTLQQMASFIYRSCGRLQAALAAGYQSSAILILFVSLGTGFGSSGSEQGLYAFYYACAGIVFLSGIAFHVLMKYSRDVVTSMSKRDSVINNKDPRQENTTTTTTTTTTKAVHHTHSETGKESLMKVVDDGSSSSMMDMEESSNYKKNNDESSIITYEDLWKKSWLCCLSLMIVVVSNGMIASWINRIQSIDETNQSLPQVLFYARNFADIVGRPFSLLLWSTPIDNNTQTFLRIVSIIAILQAVISLPLFYTYTITPTTSLLPQSDVVIISFVAIISFISGAIKTILYQRAPSLLTTTTNNNTTTNKVQMMQTHQMITLLNICYSIAVLIGILINIIIQENFL